MQIKTRLSQKDLIKVNLVLLKRGSSRVYLVLLFFYIIFSAMPLANGKSINIITILLPLMIMIVFLIAITLVGILINYRSNPRIRETIEYKFQSDFLEIKGESFSSQLTWEKIHKVTKTKNWLLIWQNRQSANVIPLRDIWEGDITTLKEILTNHKVKNNL